MKKLILLCLSILILHAQPNTMHTCEQGNTDECNHRGEAYDSNGEFSKAFRLYKKSCDLNSSRGCSHLGYMYMTGQGIKKDFAVAVQYSEKVMALGEYRLAYDKLGFIYLTGHGKVKKDKVKALHYFSLGCEKYSTLSCNMAAELEKENGNSEKLLYYYKQACVMRDGESCLRYGVAMYSGQDVKSDKEAALRAFSLGCKFENASACKALTVMIYKGVGGALPDKKLAEAYRKKACDFGAKDACGEDESY